LNLYEDRERKYMSYVVGIDLGGTKIELGLIAPDNRIVARKRIAAQTEDGVALVTERIVAVIKELELSLPMGEKILAVGMCAPGPLDNETGTFRDPPNIPGLHHAPLGPMLAKKLGVPVRLEHDAKAAALGEYHYGAGRAQENKQSKNMVYIVAGTGVGAAMIENGELIRGVQNSAGEVGHITLDRNGMVCNCGSRGCSQTYIAGPYLVKRYEEKMDRETGGEGDKETGFFAPSPLRPFSLSDLTGEDIANLATQGDEAAQAVMHEAGEALGVMIAILAVTLDSELYVIGGSVVKAGDLILQPARETAPKYALSSIAPRLRIIASPLGDDAPLLGCAYLARAPQQGSVDNRQDHRSRK
jgi:glucokinase